MHTSLRLATAAALTLFAAAPAPLAAQGTASVNVTAPYVAAKGNPCGTVAQGAGTAISIDCTPWSDAPTWCIDAGVETCPWFGYNPWQDLGFAQAHASAAASANAGQLRASTSLLVWSRTPDLTMTNFASGYTAEAHAGWSDRIVFGDGPLPAFVEFEVWLHGDMLAHSGAVQGAVGGLDGGSHARTDFTFFVNGAVGGGLPPILDTLHTYAPSGSRHVQLKTGARADAFSVLRPVEQSDRVIPFWMTLYSASSIESGTTGNHYISARASSEFGGTAGLTGVRFYDAQMTDVTGQVAYTFANGTQFITATPEPTTLALSATALALVGAVARRRRRADGRR